MLYCLSTAEHTRCFQGKAAQDEHQATRWEQDKKSGQGKRKTDGGPRDHYRHLYRTGSVIRDGHGVFDKR